MKTLFSFIVFDCDMSNMPRDESDFIVMPMVGKVRWEDLGEDVTLFVLYHWSKKLKRQWIFDLFVK